MIALQSPMLQVFISIEPVSRADMPSKRFAPIAAVQANHVILMNRSPHRYSRGTNFLGLNGLGKLSEHLMHGSDEIRNLICSDRVMSNVAPDDCRC